LFGHSFYLLTIYNITSTDANTLSGSRTSPVTGQVTIITRAFHVGCNSTAPGTPVVLLVPTPSKQNESKEMKELCSVTLWAVSYPSLFRHKRDIVGQGLLGVLQMMVMLHAPCVHGWSSTTMNGQLTNRRNSTTKFGMFEQMPNYVCSFSVT